MVLIAAIIPTPLPTTSADGVLPRYSSVRLPANYAEQFVQYATVQRIDGTIRHIYINPEAIEAIQNGSRRLPNHTVIVIEGFDALQDTAGKYVVNDLGQFETGAPFEMLHVLEKRDDWAAADFVSENRIGQWNFGSFDTDTGGYFDENMSACFHCHNATDRTDFLYSAPLLSRFIQTQQVQFLACNLPDRIAC